ncbi:unnamed protein product [Closterium sp. Naga37s-1]|nr:unnamed protein product [Closterium sp. Naga37s-1]
MADQLVVVGLAPVSFDSLKRLQVKLKGEEGDDEEQTQKGPQTQALKERLLDLLVGPDVAIEIVEDSVLDVICTDSMKKAVKKTLKKEKKSMNISVNKKVDDVVDHEVLRSCLEKLCEGSLIGKGWSACKNGLYLLSNLRCGDDNTPAHSVRLSMHLETPNKIVLVLRPDVIKFHHMKIIDVLPTDFREKFSQGKPVDLEEWMDTQLEETSSRFRCFCIPNLEHGQIIGCSKDDSSSGPNTESRTYWRKRGIEIGDDFFTVTIKLDHGERLRLPSACVLTEAGFMPVPGTIRSREMQSMFASIGSDFSFTFFGAGNVQFKNTEAGSLPVMVQTTAWTTAKGIAGLSSADALSARSLVFSRPSLSGFRRPKPALPIIREPPKPVHSDIQTDKNDDEPAEERPELVKKPEPVPAVVKLSIPTFTAWKQRVSSANCSSSSGVSSKLTKSSTLNTKDASLKQSSAAASTKEKKEPAVSAAKNRKLDVDKPPPKKAKTSHMPGKALDSSNQSKTPGKKKPEAKPEDDDISTFVKGKFKEGKLKDITLPRLKAFITLHKLGKVSGKKDELLLCVERFLTAV